MTTRTVLVCDVCGCEQQADGVDVVRIDIRTLTVVFMTGDVCEDCQRAGIVIGPMVDRRAIKARRAVKG